MKSIKGFSLVCFFTLFLGLGLLNSCGSGGDDPTPDADSFALLQSGKWKIQGVTIDGVSNNTLFAGLTVAFTSGSFATTNGEPVWSSTGTWTKGSDNNSIVRNDGVIVRIVNITESSATLTLNWGKTTLGGGKIRSVSGNHVFVFGK